ncbi:MAG: hypothetical protein JWQ87_4042 [Candidatus Sulfotelmatobacter sp.]|nr:hypothetical protein [Candidatus Sulfotelmatobacter sp.]
MKSFRPFRYVWLYAVCAVLALLPGCGGGRAASLSTPPVPGSCSLQINVWSPPTPADGTWKAFQTYILPSPAIHGVNINTGWNAIETSQGVYDFSALDGELPNYPGKEINLVFQPISYSNINNPSGGVNKLTPSYVFTAGWASSQASAPLDVVSCGPYPGNGTDPTTGYPVVYEKPFQVAYQNFINAVMQHYKGTANIGYMRFGLSVGNETDAYCTAQMQSLPSPNTFSTAAWENWISTMDSYEKSVLPNPPIQLMESLNRVDTDPTGTAFPDFEAATAVSNGFGFGNNGLQKNDIANSASGNSCTGDWCDMFDKYAGQVPLELQTVNASNPSGSDPNNLTGNLLNLIPLAVQHHATILEVLMPDLLLAFDPNFTPQNPADASFAGAYKAALTAPCAQ